jgi:phosphoribosylglycinamide formyltransferase-1
MSRARIAILISGRGSNMQAFIDACNSGALAADICLVVSNNPDAAGLVKAADLGIDTACVNHRGFETREAFDRELLDTVLQYRADLVILAGFMRILTPVFIEPFQGRLLNVHPSLLPKYPGLNTHQRALDAGDREAGVTVHFVTQELDGGPAIIQARVAVEKNDTAETLAARVIVQEHRIYPLAAAWFLEKRLTLTEQGAVFDGNILPAGGKQY